MKLPSLKFGKLISRVPIIQGGMGVGISLSGLASAVAREGGIGVISAAFPGIHEPDITTNSDEANIRVLQKEIRKARQQTNGILGVNIMVALTNYGDMVRTSLEEGVDLIFAGAGLPLDLPGYLSEGQTTKLVPIISSARAARIICKKWLNRYGYTPDGFVVEGPKAGGHIGLKREQISNPDYALEKMVKEVIDIVKEFEQAAGSSIPVIPAGGIYDGKDIHKFMKLGAAGVQLGTRFVATHECDADAAFKNLYVDARSEDMVIIQSPVGMPGRAIRNPFLDEVSKGTKAPFKCPFHCIKTCDSKKSPYCIAMALANARKGKFKYGFAFAGENAYRIKKIISVKELMESLQAEYSLATA